MNITQPVVAPRGPGAREPVEGSASSGPQSGRAAFRLAGIQWSLGEYRGASVFVCPKDHKPPVACADAGRGNREVGGEEALGWKEMATESACRSHHVAIGTRHVVFTQPLSELTSTGTLDVGLAWADIRQRIYQ
jgi:hypothetical protein